MMIFRKIQVNDISEIDIDNVGCHWTKNPNYTHTGGGSNGLTQKKKYTAHLSATVNAGDINLSATEQSNEEYPHEKEVVLNKDVKLECEVYLTDDEGDFVWGYGKKRTLTGSTGFRVDKWVK